MIFDIFEEKEWDSILLEIGSFDFYHTYRYHFFNCKKEEIPILIVYKNEGDLVAIPFLKRKINDAYSDLTSVHGKVGPVARIGSTNFDNKSFKEEFQRYLLDQRIVSVFSKLNPFVKGQRKILDGIGEVVCTGENMYFDQSQSEEEQVGQYSKSTRKKIRKLQDFVTVRECQNPKEIQFFIDRHHENMERIGGSKEYFFSREYLEHLLNYNMVDAKISFAANKENGEIMAGLLIVQTNEIVEAEIGWTVNKYRDFSPMAILWDWARRNYKNNGSSFFNIGGGPGGREGGVMMGKRRFTKNYIDFHVWKYTVNTEKYNAFCSQEQLTSETDFFPRYRS